MALLAEIVPIYLRLAPGDIAYLKFLFESYEEVAIVRTIAHLGQSLGIKVTFEGVETQSQLTLLRAMGCTTMQGYLFAKAMSATQVRAFVCGEHAVSASA